MHFFGLGRRQGHRVWNACARVYPAVSTKFGKYPFLARSGLVCPGLAQNTASWRLFQLAVVVARRKDYVPRRNDQRNGPDSLKRDQHISIRDQHNTGIGSVITAYHAETLSTTRSSSDASTSGDESAKTTFCPTPTRLSGQIPRALRRRYADEGYCSRASWHAWGKERLPRRVMFGEMLGGEGNSGGQEWDWMKDLEEDLKAFGIKFEG